MIILPDFKRHLVHTLLLKIAQQIINKTRYEVITFLKPKQVDCVLKSAKLDGNDGKEDLLAILPTGYGKSLLFELIPTFYKLLHDKPSTVAMVISPLNSIISQQKRILGSKSTIIRAAFDESDQGEEVLTSGTDTDSGGELDRAASRSPSPTRSRPIGGETDDGDDAEIYSSDESSISDNEDISDSSSKSYHYYLGHPEDFLDENNMREMAKAAWASNVTHVIIDEAHCVVTWSKDFRPKFRELDKLRAIFPQAAVVAVTATATVKMQQEICRILNMKNAQIVSTNVDRPNITYKVKKRLSQTGRQASAEESYMAAFLPYLNELKLQRELFPKTVVFTGLKWCGFGNEVGVRVLTDGNVTSAGIKEIAQFHAPLKPEVKGSIATMLMESESPIRLLFATDAFGMGIDCPDIRKVIHVSPPSTLEAYSQQTGRAGRDGKAAEAVMLVNNEDLGRMAMTKEIKEYCGLKTCRREYLAKHFDTTVAKSGGHNCCDNCAKLCQCDSCLTAPDSEHHDEVMEGFSEDQQTAVEYALHEYFRAVNSCYLPTALDPELITGLTEKLATEIAKNYAALQERDILEVSYAHIRTDFLESISSIIAQICDLVF